MGAGSGLRGRVMGRWVSQRRGLWVGNEEGGVMGAGLELEVMGGGGNQERKTPQLHQT